MTRIHKLSLTFLASFALLVGACSDDTPGTESSSTGTETGDGDGDGDQTGDGDGDPATGDGDGDQTGDGDGDQTGDGDGEGDPCEAEPGAAGCECADSSTCDEGLLCLDGGVCEPDPFDTSGDFVRVDRAGMPAVNSAVIMSKDAYNAANPADDVAMMFVNEIVDSVQALHAALDDDLTDAGFVPCALLDCIDVAGPLVLPDTIKIDYESPAGFPVGRRLTDPVIDVTLAVLLLDLADPDQNAGSLIGALNPAANDVPFLDEFPYLAAPN